MTKAELEVRRRDALARARAVHRCLATPDGKVVLALLQELVVELRRKVAPSERPFDPGAALCAEGAQRQVDNLQFYASTAEAAERTGDAPART